MSTLLQQADTEGGEREIGRESDRKGEWEEEREVEWESETEIEKGRGSPLYVGYMFMMQWKISI